VVVRPPLGWPKRTLYGCSLPVARPKICRLGGNQLYEGQDIPQGTKSITLLDAFAIVRVEKKEMSKIVNCQQSRQLLSFAEAEARNKDEGSWREQSPGRPTGGKLGGQEALGARVAAQTQGPQRVAVSMRPGVGAWLDLFGGGAQVVVWNSKAHMRPGSPVTAVECTAKIPVPTNPALPAQGTHSSSGSYGTGF